MSEPSGEMFHYSIQKVTAVKTSKAKLKPRQINDLL